MLVKFNDNFKTTKNESKNNCVSYKSDYINIYEYVQNTMEEVRYYFLFVNYNDNVYDR